MAKKGSYWIVTNTTFPNSIRVANEALVLRDAGFDVRIISIYGGNERAEFDWNGVHVFTLPLSKIMEKFSAIAAEYPVYTWYVRREVLKILKAQTVDYLHIYNTYTFRALYRWANRNQIPVTLDVAENLPEIMKSYDHVIRGMGKYLVRIDAWSKLQREAIAKSDRILLVTPEAIDYYASHYGMDRSKAYALPNLVNPELIGDEREGEIKGKLAGKFNIFYFGDTSQRRGTLFAISAMPTLLERIPEAQLVIVGYNRREEAQLLQAIANSSASEAILYEGFRPMNELGSYLKHVQVGISPLQRNVHHDTTYANKLFQYMWGGLPLVVSDCPAQANLVSKTKTGEVHRAGDVEGFVKAISKLYNDPQLYSSCKNSGLEWSESQLKWETYMTPYLNDVADAMHSNLGR